MRWLTIHGEAGFARTRGSAVVRTIVKRFDADGVVRMGDELLLEGSAGQRLFRKRQPSLTVGVRKFGILDQGTGAHPLSSFCRPHPPGVAILKFA